MTVAHNKTRKGQVAEMTKKTVARHMVSVHQCWISQCMSPTMSHSYSKPCSLDRIVFSENWFSFFACARPPKISGLITYLLSRCRRYSTTHCSDPTPRTNPRGHQPYSRHTIEATAWDFRRGLEDHIHGFATSHGLQASVLNKNNFSLSSSVNLHLHIPPASGRCASLEPLCRTISVWRCLPRRRISHVTLRQSDATSTAGSDEEFRPIEASLCQVWRRTTAKESLGTVQQTETQNGCEVWRATVRRYDQRNMSDKNSAYAALINNISERDRAKDMEQFDDILRHVHQRHEQIPEKIRHNRR